MANRNFNRVQALDKELKHVYGVFKVGSSGALSPAWADTSSLVGRSVGIKSVTKESGAGQYTLVLGTPGGETDRYPALIGMDVAISCATQPGTDGGETWQIISEQVNHASDAKLTFNFVNLNGAFDNPKNGAYVYVHLVLKNSDLALGSNNIEALP